MIGRTLLHYNVTEKLGEGGMGQVYRATDQKLGRDVAIKVLPESFAADAERLARFGREAKLLAGLNHPNIAAIYGIEAVDNQRFLVLELIDGEDLSEMLLRGPLPLARALDLARQVATALEVAHEQGIVHRDLKPANILVNKDGIVKVLDFGLGKAYDAVGDRSSPQLTQSPTVLHSSPTMVGVILGTAAYMSPEQARGRVVDKRADIFAFGAVLFEMLTGRIVFAGETVSDTLAAVLKEEPDYNTLPANTPPRLRALLKRCLEKDVKQRLRDIGEARIAIEEIAASKDAVGAAATSAAEKPSALKRSLPWALFGTTALIAAWLLALRNAPAPPAQGSATVTSHIVAPEGVEFDLTRPGIALSPDGSQLAFIGTGSDGLNRLYVWQCDTGQFRLIEDTEGAITPFWSPDGRHVAFNTGVHLKRVDLATGSTRVITEVKGADGTWSHDDLIIVSLYTGSTGSRLMKVPAGGGVAEPLLGTERTVTEEFPQFLPDDRHFLYSRLNVDGSGNDGIAVAAMDSKESVQVIRGLTNARYSAGHVLSMQNDQLVAQTFDLHTRELGAAVHRVAAPIQTMSFPYCGFFTCADNGTLAYVEGVPSAGFTELVWVDRAGNELERTGITGDLYNHRLSHDERRLVMDISTPETAGDIWVYDLARKSSRCLSKDAVNESLPVWSADDKEVYFFRGPEMYRVSVSGGEPVKLFSEEKRALRPSDASADGRFLLCVLRRDPVRELAVWDIPGATLTQLTSLNTFIDVPVFAPEGNWISYISNETGRDEVYVEGFPDRSERFRVSKDGGNQPNWSSDGRELFYVSLAGDMMSVPVNMNATDTSPIGEPVKLFATRVRDGNYEVTADGKRFLLNERLDPKSTKSLVLIQNWPGRIVDVERRP
jgi:serine/threonine protein kinase